MTAELRPVGLQKFGINEPWQLRRLGFDALHLVDPIFCTEANAAFGAESVIEAFLTSASDAVALSGSEAVETLGITMEKLLKVCAGAPTEAMAVINQSKDQSPLRGVSVRVVLDSGLRATQLKAIGVNFAHVVQDMHANRDDIFKLGFTL